MSCTFCNYDLKKCHKGNNYGQIIHLALYNKYSTSQKYAQMRIINDLIFARKSKATTVFKDLLYWDYTDEYLLDYYSKFTLPIKFKEVHPLIFHEPAHRALEKRIYQLKRTNYQRERVPRRVTSFTASKVLQNLTSTIRLREINLTQNNNSIFQIQSYLQEVVSRNSIAINDNVKQGLWNIYSKFIERRAIKREQQKVMSARRSIDRGVQTASYPVIRLQDKRFLQDIIRQQQKHVSPYKNKLENKNRKRNSVEIHDYRSGTEQKPSVSRSTIKIYSSQQTSARVSAQRQSRTKSQSYDSNKAIECRLTQTQKKQRR